MASKNSASLALLFTLNILFFTLTYATDCGCTPSPKVPSPKAPTPKVPSPKVPSPKAPTPQVPSPKAPTPQVPTPQVPSPKAPTPKAPTPQVPSPKVPTPSSPGSSKSCPIDTLKLGVCGNVLTGLLNIQLGQGSTQPCCSLVQGLADLDAAVCLCTALRANVLGINLNVPISLSLLLNACDKKLPSGFQCA